MTIKVAICAPLRVHVHFEAAFCAMRACTALRDAGFEQCYFYVPGTALLEHVRSKIACDALDWGAEVLLWVDDDITFDPQEAVKLVRGALLTQSMVAGVCALRGASRVNVAFTEKNKKVRFFNGGGINKVDNAGCGMTAIHRSVFERLREEWEPVVIYDQVRTPYYRTRFWDGAWPGEDYSFSRLMTHCGLQPYADTSIHVTHHGSYGFRVEDVLKGFGANLSTVEVDTD